MFEKIQSDLVQQDKENIEKRIQELEDLSYGFISQAYEMNQDLTIRFMKEERIGGLSIIGKILNTTKSSTFDRFGLIFQVCQAIFARGQNRPMIGTK